MSFVKRRLVLARISCKLLFEDNDEPNHGYALQMGMRKAGDRYGAPVLSGKSFDCFDRPSIRHKLKLT